MTTQEAVAAFRRRLPGAPPAPVPAAPQQEQNAPSDDSRQLAREVAESFGELARVYREHHGLTPEEARRRAAATPEGSLQRIQNSPPEQVSWWDLGAVSQADPEKALELWEGVKRAARQEVRAGHCAGRAVLERGLLCWDRALFLAVRAELMESLGSPSALEQQLIDQLAQWQVLLWGAQQTLTAHLKVAHRRAEEAVRAPYEPPLLSEGEARERAVAAVERLHHLYLKTLKALQDQRRVPGVVVRRAGQVNLAQQQVNLHGIRPVSANPFARAVGSVDFDQALSDGLSSGIYN